MQQHRTITALASVAFFLSGVAALLYQVVWQRLLVIFSGSDIHSATVIVSAFMAGLGLGTAVGGRIADRVGRADCVLLFAAAELAVAFFGYFSADLYYGLVYRHLGDFGFGLVGRAAILFVSLLWPTFFMGVSLPLLVRGLAPIVGRAASVTGALYGMNTLGAATGALVVTWYLLPQSGLATALQVGSAINVVVAVAVLPVVWTLRPETSESPPATPPAHRARPPRASRRHTAATSPPATVTMAAWVAMYGVAGFLALSLEIVWFRLLGVLQKSTSLTFGTLLAIYLAGLGLGAVLGSRGIRRSRAPAHTFLALSAAAGILAGVGVLILLRVIADPETMPWLSAYLGSYEPLSIEEIRRAWVEFAAGSGPFPTPSAWLYIGIPALLIGPSTMLMGASFPFVQQAVQTDPGRIGRRVGAMVAANIAGCSLGAVITGWWLIGWLGAFGTLALLVLASAAFPLWSFAMALPQPPRRWPVLVATSLVTGLLVFIGLPDGASAWARLHGVSTEQLLHGEDGSGLSALKAVSAPQPGVVVYVNGLGQSWIPYGGVHTVLGALPAFLHPDPRDAAVIGLGSGDTLFALAARSSFERIASIEIVRPQLATLRTLIALRPYEALRTVLGDPRIRHIQGDGRLHLMQGTTRYDVIEADALRPTSAFAGNLYSEEYFILLRARLNPGGLAVTWAPTPRVLDTFVKVFPHVLIYGDIAIGSNEPLAFNPAAVADRLADSTVQRYFGRAGIDINGLMAQFLARVPRAIDPSFDRSTLRDINSDLFPKDEYAVPAQSGG